MVFTKGRIWKIEDGGRRSCRLREVFGENGIAKGWKPGQVIIPTMGNHCTITLSENEIGQVLDGLEVRADAWEKTADYLRSDVLPEGEEFSIEECSDAMEAEAIASDYRSIIKKIRTQRDAQG